jgi:hypothetical protein
VTEAIQRVLDTRECFEGASGDIQHPRVSRADVGEDELVVNRLLIDEILRKFGARNCGHKASKTFELPFEREHSVMLQSTLRMGRVLEAGDLIFLPHLASRAGW